MKETTKASRLVEVIFGTPEEETFEVILRVLINIGVVGAMTAFIRATAGWWFF